RKLSSFHDYLMSYWEKEFFPKSNISDYRNFWNSSLRNGVFNYTPEVNNPVSISKEGLSRTISASDNVKSSGFEVVITESVALGTGMHANNPWLMGFLILSQDSVGKTLRLYQ
ncbi:MAG: hypothetical protein IPN67_20220, partial [Bacteroidales bacterium]|nr:hypothetical protein [Bacteroidales bacterium]